MEGYAQVALGKELFIAPFGERFKTTFWKSLTDKIYQYLEPFT